MADQKKFVPFVSAETNMKEFTLKALLIGLVFAVVLGAANAYLGLKAGMTIAATYPAAVLGMAMLRLLKGNILEENLTRTVGSIGESVAAGAIFTLPAFYISGIWPDFLTAGHYITSSLILIAGGILGIMFVALLRRVMVEDAELPFPESVAAAEIHKAGQSGSGGSKFLFWAMAMGGLIKILGELRLFKYLWEKFVTFGQQVISGTIFKGQGGMLLSSPGVSPAYMGVGYIIGPRLGALNFSGGLLAWGLLAPMILYFLVPNLDFAAWASFLMSNDATLTQEAAMAKVTNPMYQIDQVWRYIVRPIAIGGMLVSAAFTLYKMRKSLITGVGRSISDVKKAASGSTSSMPRTEKDISFSWIMVGILAVAIMTFSISYFIFDASIIISVVAATVMIVLAFFFAAVSGYLVGIMGSSNNPISGLTLTALVVTALILVGLGVQGNAGVATVLGVAAIVCVAAAVAGEMLQDLKAGHILGGTPWRMQIGDIIGVILAGAVMFVVLAYLNEGDIASGRNLGYQGGFGSKNLSAPQAGLMAILSRGIVEGAMAWPLIITGMLMGVAFILMQIKSPMLVSVGMYLPIETTFAIFVGGIIKGGVDHFKEKRKLNEAQKVRVENTGVLLASGLIAGEALMGLLIAILAAFGIFLYDYFSFFKNPTFLISLIVIALVAYVLIRVPLKAAGKPDEPAPPSAGM
ncbi:MAG TPA: oligopeptide transporter, OPT family [Bacteroidales bacterium]|nr:oligopeptide transporter, OPT family [Bacteroidales bacterium]HPS72730.1 oligopeptide transporter, OPT family [Bacteroidales bacterium]